MKHREWIDEWCRLVAGDLPFPWLVWPTEVVGRVTAQAAEPTGIAAGTPVCAGTVDAWAEAFSVEPPRSAT